jgi:hypothetical protein
MTAACMDARIEMENLSAVTPCEVAELEKWKCGVVFMLFQFIVPLLGRSWHLSALDNWMVARGSQSLFSHLFCINRFPELCSKGRKGFFEPTNG